MALLLVLLVLMLSSEPIISQTNNHHNDPNDFLGLFCGRNVVTSLPNFIKNRNTTLNDIRMQLLSKGVVYAKAQALSAGDPVFAAAQCRNYLSVDRCVACFDAGVSKLVNCTNANGYVIFDNCFIRYEDFDEFYTDPYFMMDGTGLQYLSCGNQSASQPTTFNQGVDGVLSNIRDATPKTSNFYVASTRQIISENATVYATTQCIANINQTICQTCMNTAYDKLTSCLPSTQGSFADMACFVRYSETPFFDDNQITDISTVLKGHSSKLVAIVAAVIGGVVLFFLILVLWLFYRWKKSKKTAQGPSDLNGAVYYNYKDLMLATDNFSQEKILGKGGFGEVFKAILDDENIMAVKRIQVQHAGGKEEFENEVKLISNIQHRNLLRLLGWSSEGSNLFLVLEYMPNGSLDRYLWGAQRGTLDWNQRYEIILGIARGLVHLHDEYHFKIVHRDIKSSNILLSDDFRPKIADFGLARFHPKDQSHVSTGFAGTLGYTAPEYALNGILSDKVDTYSFGIVVLEIISGRRSTELRPYGSSTCFLLEDEDGICPICRKVCMDEYGEHAVHCKELPGFKYRHDWVRDTLWDILRRAGISAKKEAPVNFLSDPAGGRSTLRPADLLVFGWAGGKHACVDLTGVSPLVGLRDSGFVAGQAVRKAESKKIEKHAKACEENQHVFVPLAFDTFGSLAPEATRFLTRVQRVINSSVSAPGGQGYVFSRLGFAIQKGVAAQLVARLPVILM